MHPGQENRNLYRILSLPVTVAAVLLANILQTPNPLMVLIIPVVFFCYTDGYVGGAISAAVAFFYALIFFSNDGALFTYSQVNTHRLITNFIGMTIIVLLVGKLKSKAVEIIQGEQDNVRKMTQMNAELNQAAQEARSANQAKSFFISSVSHDIRTPINVILGLSNLAMEEEDNQAAVHDYLEKIHSSGQHLLDLINNVLDLSKIESGEVEFYPETYRLTDFVKEVELMFRPLCDDKGVYLTVAVKDEGIEALLVDKVRFKQVLFNLLSNAVKFTPPGGTVTLFIELTRINERLAGCTFKVKDTGPGMSRAFQEKMFEAFARERKPATADVQGTGLGLRIVKSVVDILNGTLSVESEEGQGSTFTAHFEFPTAGQPGAAGPEDLRMSLDKINFEGRNILLAEDNPLNSKITSRLLMKKGVIVTCAENGNVALETFKNSPEGFFDAILMDIQMPEMDGLEAAGLIRSLARQDAREVPIIAMTANAFGEDVEKSIKSGMNRHLTKPTSPANLYETLASLIK